VVFTSTRAGSTPEAIAEASAGPPEAEEPEPGNPVPDPKGKLPEPEVGNVVDGVDGVDVPEELARQAIRPTPNPAAIAKRTTSTTIAIVQTGPLLAVPVDTAGAAAGATQ
jgi:hypothetical protein